MRLPTINQRIACGSLEVLLVVVTLLVGWLVWSVRVWGRGQTPAMQVLQLRFLSVADQQVATKKQMARRESLVALTWVFAPITLLLSLSLYLVMYVSRDRRQPWDRAAGTVMVRGPRAASLASSVQPSAAAFSHWWKAPARLQVRRLPPISKGPFTFAVILTAAIYIPLIIVGGSPARSIPVLLWNLFLVVVLFTVALTYGPGWVRQLWALVEKNQDAVATAVGYTVVAIPVLIVVALVLALVVQNAAFLASLVLAVPILWVLHGIGKHF